MLANRKMKHSIPTYIMQNGENGAVLVWIERQEAPSGGVCCSLVSETGEIIGTWWESGPKKQRRGGATRYCIGREFDALPEKQRLAVLKLRGRFVNDGRIKSRKRSCVKRRAELADLLGSWMLRTLMEAGAIYEKDGWFYVDRRFLFRG